MIRARSAIAPSWVALGAWRRRATGSAAGGGASAGGSRCRGRRASGIARGTRAAPARPTRSVADRERDGEGDEQRSRSTRWRPVRDGRMGAGCRRESGARTGRRSMRRIIAQSRRRRGPVAPPVRIERAIPAADHVRPQRPSIGPRRSRSGRPGGCSAPREAGPGDAKPESRRRVRKRPVSLWLLVGVGALAVARRGRVLARRQADAAGAAHGGRATALPASSRPRRPPATRRRSSPPTCAMRRPRSRCSRRGSPNRRRSRRRSRRCTAISRRRATRSRISEIEQVLLVASQQLQLAGNVPSALTALQLADAKLQRLDRPQFVPLRRALARDMDRLKAVPYVDIVGMSLKLDQAIAAVDALPLAMDERVPPPAPDKAAPPADDSPWRRFLRELWGDAKQLIRIEVADRPAAPLVPMAQQYFLRENLKLRLLTARIALLARNDASFQADLAAVEAWLKQYFDTRAKPVQALQATRAAARGVADARRDARSDPQPRSAARAASRAGSRAGTRGRRGRAGAAIGCAGARPLLVPAARRRGGGRRAGGAADDRLRAVRRAALSRRALAQSAARARASPASSPATRCCASSSARSACPRRCARTGSGSSRSAPARSRTPRSSRCSKAASAGRGSSRRRRWRFRSRRACPRWSAPAPRSTTREFDAAEALLARPDAAVAEPRGAAADARGRDEARAGPAAARRSASSARCARRRARTPRRCASSCARCRARAATPRSRRSSTSWSSARCTARRRANSCARPRTRRSSPPACTTAKGCAPTGPG